MVAFQKEHACLYVLTVAGASAAQIAKNKNKYKC